MPDISRSRILVCYSGSSTFTNTTLEYLKSFSAFLDCDIYYLHVTNNSIPQVNLNIFDVVLLSYCVRLCFPGYVSDSFLCKLSKYTGVKAVFIQDEYDFVDNEVAALQRISPDIIFTCIPEDQVQQIYPPNLFPHVEFVQVLTGYVPCSIPEFDILPLKSRPIDIGYRGRDISYRYGLYGTYKYQIGQEFLNIHSRYPHNLKLDVRMDESSRIYGDNWYQWLSKCKTTLGSPSGSNIFDFDGSIAQAFSKARFGSYSVPQHIIDKVKSLDCKFNMGQISPRVFEASAMGCALILIRGPYSGILKSGIHYLPVEPDFSNLSDVIDSIHDINLLSTIANRAHKDLILSRLFSYEAFISTVSEKLQAKISKKSTSNVSIPVAPQFTDITANPLHEYPSLYPMSTDTFQLKTLLYQTQTQSPRLVIRYCYYLLKRVITIPINRFINLPKLIISRRHL
jgi:hypothetical protein